ncbi:MAG: hypothetical protein QOF94_1652, partial [Acidobacteriaceae bacterium]
TENFNPFAAAEMQRRSGRLAIHQCLFLCNQLLHAGPAGVWKLRHEELIEALALAFCANRKSFLVLLFQDARVGAGVPTCPVPQTRTSGATF